jgi:hypothetical protein
MKQIGANVIADNSITSTKPAESFMKRVVVADNAAGNAVGWNPDGVANDFTITEPAVDSRNSYVSVSVEGFGSPSCHAWPVSGGFNMQCEVAPANSLTLHYVVETLHVHIIA